MTKAWVARFRLTITPACPPIPPRANLSPRRNQPADPMPATLVHIHGRVQGVGYRAWTERQAQALGLRGWVKNEPDGSVTALVSGPEAAVARMLELFRGGPKYASVTKVTTGPADQSDVPAGFRQLR